MTANSEIAADLMELVRAQILAVDPDIEPIAIDPEARLKDLGIDSLGRMDIISGSVEALGIDAPLHLFAQAETLGDLVRLFMDETQR